MPHDDSAPITIVIPNWNGRRWLAPCLDSVTAQSTPAAEVILVDDGSTDDSVTFVRATYPEVQVVELAENRGFCRAVNAGIETAGQQAILLLNNDARLHPECLRILTDALHYFPDATFFALQILDATGERVESAGAGLTPEGVPFPRSFGSIPDASLQPSSLSLQPSAQRVFGSSGGAGLYRRALFDDIGLFDEALDMYLEDVDLDMRARLRGHQCLYLPQAIAYHMGSTTLGASNPRVVSLLIRNRLLVLLKGLPAGLLVRLFGRLLLGQIRSAVFYAKEGQAVLFMDALLQTLAKLPAFIGRRAALQAQRKLSAAEFKQLLERE